MSRREVLVITDVSKQRIASIVRVTTTYELGTMLAVTSNRSISSQRVSVASYC
jgi:hypothetical protein